jgi:DNA-directed RNA polymerase III subunit RPC2
VAVILPAEMAKKNECPYDAGGYFIVRGNEKVYWHFQDLLFNNNKSVFLGQLDSRVDVKEPHDSGTGSKGNMRCQVTSSTHGMKTRTNVIVNKGKYNLKQNNFQDVS